MTASSQPRWPYEDSPFVLTHHDYIRGKTDHLKNPAYPIMVIALLALLASALLLIVFMLPRTMRAAALDVFGKTTTGTVTQRTEEYHRRNNTYYVRYQFRDDGKSYSETQVIIHDHYQHWTEGTAVKIEYVPFAPSISALTEDKLANTVMKQGWSIAAFMSGVDGLLFLIVRRHRRRAHQLTYEGRVLRGEIVALEGKEDSHKDFIVTVDYRFVTPEGREMSNKKSATANHLAHKPLPGAGDPVAILYLNDNHYTLL